MGEQVEGLDQAHGAVEAVTMEESPAAATVGSFLSGMYKALDPIRGVLEELNWEPTRVIVLGHMNSGESAGRRRGRRGLGGE